MTEKYRCMGCHYTYDSNVGDPGTGIDPETSFERISESWMCPGCGVRKESFQKVD